MRLLATSSDIHKALVDALEINDVFSIAVAWATTDFKAHETLSRRRDCIRRLIVGTDSYITSPEFLSDYAGLPCARWMPQTGPLFHPKVYLLESGDRWDAVVGSANFTQSGMQRNVETAIHASSDDGDPRSLRDSIEDLIDGYWSRAQPFDSDDLAEYEAAWKSAAGARRRLRQRFAPSAAKVRHKRKAAVAAGSRDLLAMTWDDYYLAIQGGEHPEAFKPRLDLLEQVRTWFGYDPSLKDMDAEKRARIAGIRNPDTEDIDWFWFGAMVGAGNFKNLILEHPTGLSRALDAIPLTGTLEREHYEEYSRRFAEAFAHLSRGGGGIATATRLLCMRRPDWFICLDGPNRKICRAVGAPMDPGLDRYWDLLIHPLTTQAPWWSEPEPEDPLQKRAWINRMAMLDAIFYEGTGP